MTKELSNRVIYNDFLSKVILTDDEKIVLDMLIKKESIIKISQKINMSDRNVSRIVKDLKRKYADYKQLEMAKLGIFKS